MGRCGASAVGAVRIGKPGRQHPASVQGSPVSHAAERLGAVKCTAGKADTGLWASVWSPSHLEVIASLREFIPFRYKSTRRRDALHPHPPHRHSTSSGSDGLAMAFVVGFVAGAAFVIGGIVFLTVVGWFAYRFYLEWAE